MHRFRRRGILKAAGALVLPVNAFGQQNDDDSFAITQSPEERGLADFSGNWAFVGDPAILADGVSSPLPSDVISKYAMTYRTAYDGGFSGHLFRCPRPLV